MLKTFPVTVLAAALALVACTSPQASSVASAAPQAAPPAPPGITCVWQPELRSGYYTVLDYEHLVIEGGNKSYYLATLLTRCYSLDTSLKLAFNSHSNELCSAGDAVLTGQERCPIVGLEPVASVAAAKKLLAARAAPPPVPPPAP